MVDGTGTTAQKRFSYAAAKYGDTIYATQDFVRPKILQSGDEQWDSRHWGDSHQGGL